MENIRKKVPMASRIDRQRPLTCLALFIPPPLGTEYAVTRHQMSLETTIGGMGGAADGNRTHVSALGGQCSTTELQPQVNRWQPVSVQRPMIVWTLSGCQSWRKISRRDYRCGEGCHGLSNAA